MATIEERGPFQFRAKIRRRGRSVSRTFETKSAAEQWARIEEGRIAGDEYVDRGVSKRTSLAAAMDLYETDGLNWSAPSAKNVRAKLRYWRASEFAVWSIVSLRPSDLIAWRREVLDEEGADDGQPHGPDAECSAQTVVHRLNTLSQVYKHWRAHRDPSVVNPVIEGVRPSVSNNRDRRLYPTEEKKLLTAVGKSTRPWLKAAVIISLESALRQAELAGLEWGRVCLKGWFPYVLLPASQTKNRRAREVPLSARAVDAFKTLKPKNADERDSVFPVETPRAIGHAWRDVVKDDKFPDLRWHDLRHEATSRFFENTNLRDNEIMAITGHLRPEMLKRYTHLRSKHLAPRLNKKTKSKTTSRVTRTKQQAVE